jgi:hypothetical protein
MQTLCETDVLWRPLFYEKFDCDAFRRMCSTTPTDGMPHFMFSSFTPTLPKKEGPWDQPPKGYTWKAYFAESLVRQKEHLKIQLGRQVMMKCTYQMQMDRDASLAARCALRDISYRNRVRMSATLCE